MLIIPKIVSTPILSSSFKSASATVILLVIGNLLLQQKRRKKIAQDRVESFRLFRIAEVAGVLNDLEPRACGYFIPQRRYLILGAPDQQRWDVEVAKYVACVRPGKCLRGKLVSERPNFGHDGYSFADYGLRRRSRQEFGSAISGQLSRRHCANRPESFFQVAAGSGVSGIRKYQGPDIRRIGGIELLNHHATGRVAEQEDTRQA